MITVLMEDCNGFSQDLYKSLIDSLQLHMVECTCGRKGCLVFFGHYHRLVKYLSNAICLCIQRVFCKECGKTNALLPSLLVPYSQVPLRDQQEILQAMDSGVSPEPVMERNNLVDENHIKYIFSQFVIVNRKVPKISEKIPHLISNKYFSIGGVSPPPIFILSHLLNSFFGFHFIFPTGVHELIYEHAP